MTSLDGFVAGPGHTMDFMDRATVREGPPQEYTGAILAGRDGFDGAIRDKPPYGGAWQGPIFVLTHHPEDARPAENVTFLSCTVEEAVRIGLEAAHGKNLQVFSPPIAKQLLALGLVDQIDIHVAPVLLGDGIRLYDAPGGELVHLLRDGAEPTLAFDLRYLPAEPRRAETHPNRLAQHAQHGRVTLFGNHKPADTLVGVEALSPGT